MKPFRFLTILALALTMSCSNTEQSSIQNKTTAQSKKGMVEASFQQWQDGTGSPFDLLSEDMRWTISGFNQYAGTYARKPFEEELIKPFNERIEEPLKPTKWKVYEDGDVVIIHFDAETMK